MPERYAMLYTIHKIFAGKKFMKKKYFELFRAVAYLRGDNGKGGYISTLAGERNNDVKSS